MRIRPVVGILFTAALLAACGASEDEQRQEAFCEEVPNLLQDITAEIEGVGADPEAAEEVLGDALDRMDDIEAPEAAADEWDRLRTAWHDMADLFAQADLTDPAANADLVPELQRLQTELVESGDDVDQWGEDNC